MRNILSIDIEDYFHPTEVQQYVSRDSWGSLPSTVERNTGRLLEILAKHRIVATCFVVGWVAERFPALVREVASAGHEVGNHSFFHECVFSLSPLAFKEDTLRAQAAIEAACGVQTKVYRAPSFSINRESMWALDELSCCGYSHDSSIYPISHDRYGIPGFARAAQAIKVQKGSILEVPPAAVVVGTSTLPVGGGAYLRLLPYRYTAAGVRRLNREGIPAMIYTHPWEFDANVPRLAQGRIASWRTYTGLASMTEKLEKLLREFEFTSMSNVYPCGSDGARIC